MKKVLILFAHPAFHKSRINKKLVEGIHKIEGVTFNNLYENYPDFFIDVKKEQKLLVQHDIIVWHHPFYWYSCPSLLKEWIDLVLEHNFAYGTHGRALEGKTAISVISSGGRKEVYSQKGANHFTINQFLAPFVQTANLCRMNYLPPFVVHGSHKILPDELTSYQKKYIKLISALQDDSLIIRSIGENTYINESL
ncbi:MAG: NAD(P)H-dependent oxidoreductase [Prolixibacteraceae bacterium]|nr:NAD(P)H-dependent oxidoreductase [Prolixibacteraceae bacterium]